MADTLCDNVSARKQFGEPMVLDADLQTKLHVVRPASSASMFLLFIRRLATNLVSIVLLATVMTASTTLLTVWVSTLPAVTAVSLPLSFRFWSQIIEFNAYIWLGVFVLGLPLPLAKSVQQQIDQ